MSDPRERGFSYGVGWGSAPKPALYHQAVQTCRALTSHAVYVSNLAWRLEMKIKEVRIASNDAERERALRELATEMERYPAQIQLAPRVPARM